MQIDRRNSAPNLAYTLQRLPQLFVPNVLVFHPPADVRLERDVEVRTRDGIILRGQRLSASGCRAVPGGNVRASVREVTRCPNGAYSDTCRRSNTGCCVSRLRYASRRGRGGSARTRRSGARHGYAVVNADLRGFGHSGGIGELLSDLEAQDYYEPIERAGTQSWSTGRVGLNGVSYLALSQWRVAALRPPHLAAICPWEGWSDCYRDFARPGGVREDGLLPLRAALVARSGRVKENLRAEQLARLLFDDWWATRCPHLERIETPALICGSFSDQGLHARGCFEAFRRIGSREKWLYTHRGGKWATYYSEEALNRQLRFFDCSLKGEHEA